jgi:HK97 family phage major capsid protein
VALYNAQPISRHDVGPLLVQPVERQSLAFLTATVVRTDGFDFRISVVAVGPDGRLVNEGQDIPITDPTLAEVTVTPRKVAGLVVVSRELAMDSTPGPANVVGAGLARDIARKVDAALFGALAAPAPSGLAALSGIQVAVGAYTDLDVFAEAISKAETVGVWRSCARALHWRTSGCRRGRRSSGRRQFPTTA